MRITNKHYSPLELIAELTQSRGIGHTETAKFFSGEHSSHDWLLYAWAEKIEAVLDSFSRYGVDVSPTQFIRDNGIDVLLRSSGEDEMRRVGFQLKSNNEANRDKARKHNEKTLIGTLKSQGYEAEPHVDDWWVVCAFDMTQHHKLVSSISSELLIARRTLKVRVLDACQAMALLRMEPAEIDAFCTLFLCRDDEILVCAKKEVAALSISAAHFVLEHVVSAIDQEHRLSHEEMADTLQGFLRSCKSESTPEALSTELEHAGIIHYSDSRGNYRVTSVAFPGLCAMYYDARARHDLNSTQAGHYVRVIMSQLLGDLYEKTIRSRRKESIMWTEVIGHERGDRNGV